MCKTSPILTGFKNKECCTAMSIRCEVVTLFLLHGKGGERSVTITTNLSKPLDHLPLLIQRFLRNLGGMLTRKVTPRAVTASWRLLPRLPVTYKCTGRGWREESGKCPAARCDACGLSVYTAHLHDLLLLCGRDKVPESFLHHVFPFGGL